MEHVDHILIVDDDREIRELVGNYLKKNGLRTTIVRPGGLTDEPGSGHVTIAESTGRGSISREDVAGVLLAVLHEPDTVGRTFEVISGQTPIDAALR